MKLNFGSAKDRIEGFTNVDALDWEGNTDIIHNMVEFPYPFESESIDEIRTVENLEHLSFKITDIVVCEFSRILKKEGKLNIQVPDAGKAMEYYVNNQVCECVPHKAVDGEFKADEDCFNCAGKAIINPMRWLFTFTGAQKHPFDAHLNIFTRDLMTELLERHGFTNIKYKDNPYKIKVSATKQ